MSAEVFVVSVCRTITVNVEVFTIWRAIGWLCQLVNELILQQRYFVAKYDAGFFLILPYILLNKSHTLCFSQF